ncbi:efflux transporter outer membrane subunit [Swingsia samuiensis]|uniref:Efflux transporter outer membrane subunit n=1 Tax=Swingsia samuiensis TaxID=1293412 RepID=A0A4Y6UJT5_9PROT|nr:efflux transporter outer membrane subunit [Swingsia samuiensis]QDH17070.1 efflux transporter outer membrane subunit [Swingsia samuiensis]
MSATFFSRALLSGCALVVLSGCLKVGPKYHEPHPWAPQHYADHSGAPNSVISEEHLASQWWKMFKDPELASLEDRIIQQNLSFRLATANLAQSRAQLMMAGAERFPALSASGSYQRSQHSTKQLQEILGRVGGQVGRNNPGLLDNAESLGGGDVSVPLLNQWRNSIDASYEVDLWGRVAHQYDAAKADLQATDEERRSVLIAQQADMAKGYLTLRGDQRRLHVLNDSLNILRNIAGLSQDRYRSGLVTEVDVDAAQGRVHDTEAEEAQLEQKVAQEENALALLLGAPPSSLNDELEKTQNNPTVPPVVPVGLPSELAHRRPDIREAEAKLRAAVAEVGEATADFYPKVTINADFGFQTLSFRDLGFWNARAWNVGPSISLPIFQGGRLRGQLELKKYAQKAAAISYQQTVIKAWHDVDNALIAYRDEQLRRQGLEKGVNDDRRTLVLVQSQYRSGLTNYLNVLDAQSRLQNDELTFVDSNAVVATNLARLYNALGGGWEEILPEGDVSKKSLSSATPGP